MSDQHSLSFTCADGHVTVTGALDRDHVGDAWSERRAWLGDSGDLVFDLAGVSKVDSAGLALLIQLQAELAGKNRSLSLQNVNTQLRQFAEVSGVTDLLSLSYTPSE
ncbi:STAS domain-containing protein [Aliidiomarina sanyensis]|uniref:STAS domain-containing protein n=1 Tax=Aliidiomarina sanyensis TaxID=1249555 RepID=UPI001300B81D|nr:STAS domain-containing protein [Aliidiomarina sanyensis]